MPRGLFWDDERTAVDIRPEDLRARISRGEEITDLTHELPPVWDQDAPTPPIGAAFEGGATPSIGTRLPRVAEDEDTPRVAGEDDALDPDRTPPALPFWLRHDVSVLDADDEAWLRSLPRAAREVLEDARKTKPEWPFADRVPGAIAQPLALAIDPRRRSR